MGSKSGGKIKVSEYSMSMHVGICAAGENLELLNVKVGEKVIWQGAQKNRDVFKIDLPDLFGGNKKEGGVRGALWWLNGDRSQTLPAPLFQRLGLTRSTCPGFRGLASIFFTGFFGNSMSEGDRLQWPGYADVGGSPPIPEVEEEPQYDDDGNPVISYIKIEDNTSTARGFTWCTNNPYLKTISARVRRPSEGLNPSIALIQIQDSSEGIEQFASNPAHIIFECMTNRDWGMGESYGAMNIGSFEAVAQTLYDENFGINILWTRQSKIEDFIGEILGHIQGALYPDPATGKHTLKLLRADYDFNTLKIVNESNAKLSKFKRKVWSEISNEMTVTWTNPETGKEETVTVQDNAAIAMQGGVAPDSRNYHGIPNQQLAITVAERDLAAVVHPIATCDATVSRELWETVTFDVVRLQWAKYGIADVAFRVASVRAGANNRTVILSLYEDIFARATASYLPEIDTGWVNPSPLPTEIADYYLGTLPAFMQTAALQLNDPAEIVYPEAMTAVCVAQNTLGDVGYNLFANTVNVNGETVLSNLGLRSMNSYWELSAAIPQEAMTTIRGMFGYKGILPNVGDFVLFGTEDATSEIAVVTAIDAVTGYTLARGVLDTTPKEWPIGTPAFVISELTEVPDSSRYSAGEEAVYKFQTITPRGSIPLADVTALTETLTDRPHRPNRPANVQIEGVAFGTYEMGAAASATVTWANRNRTTEATQVLKWTDASAAPEAGQTTVIVITDTSGDLVREISGLTGTSYELTRLDLSFNAAVDVTLYAECDGLRSLQGHTIRVEQDLEILTLSGDELGNDLAFSGDEFPGNLGVI
jgi:hypothetical protein